MLMYLHIFFGEMYVQIICFLKIWVVSFLIRDFNNSLYILDTSPLCVFSPNTLNISFHSLLACMISVETSAVIPILVTSRGEIFFLLWLLLRYFSLSLLFCSLNMKYLTVDLICFAHFWFLDYLFCFVFIFVLILLPIL